MLTLSRQRVNDVLKICMEEENLVINYLLLLLFGTIVFVRLSFFARFSIFISCHRNTALFGMMAMSSAADGGHCFVRFVASETMRSFDYLNTKVNR